MTKIINVFAPDWSPAESYGRLALELSNEIESLGVQVNRMGANAPHKKHIVPVFGGVVLGYPTSIRHHGPMALSGPRIALTMFESTQLPPRWNRYLNMFNATIVPTDWLVDVFKSSGVETPIHVQPLGISSAFTYTKRPADRQPYTFLAFADRGARKGWHVAGQAFMRAFGDDERYQLILKARPNGLNKVANFTNPNVNLIRDEMSDLELKALYDQTDCLLFPSAGEGQGLPPLEYAATGGPVIATNWGGLAETLPQWGLPINYDLVPAWGTNPVFGGLGMWAEPDIDDLAQTMKFVASHQDYMLQKGVEASKFVHRHYAWRKLAEKVLDVWEQVNDGERTFWAAV